MDELNLNGLDMPDHSAIDHVNIDHLLTDDVIGSGEFNVTDTELLNLMAPTQMSPNSTGTDYGQLYVGSPGIDRLVNLPLTDFVAPIASQELEPDPLVSNHMLRNQQQQHNMNSLMMQQQRQAQMNNMNIPEPNPMMDQGMHQMMTNNNGMSMQQQQMPQNNMQRDRTIEHLEQEKMKLLAKLNEITHQQGAMNSPMNDLTGMQPQQQQPSNDQMSQQQILLMMQQQMSSMQQQQQQQQPNIPMASLMQQRQQQQRQPGLGDSQGSLQQKSTLVNAVAGMSVKDTEESPLTSFLRAKRGGGGGVSAIKSASMKGPSASVFSAEGGVSVDPFNKGRGKLSGAMDRSIETHAMIKQLAMRSGGKSDSSRNGNEQWDGSTESKGGFKYSGILPKHASDGHLLRSPGMPRSGPKPSFSKDNLLYGLSRTKGRVGSQSKEQLNRMTKKSSSSKLSSGNLRREDSCGVVPRRARTNGVSKYKFGVSGSTGNLGSFSNLGSLGNLEAFAQFDKTQQSGTSGGAPGGDGAASGRYQGNAQW